jgi:tRNA pseudouridine38-40 synthase
MRFKLTLEYAGTRYSGWQIQPNARTVQGECAAAIGAVLRTRTFEFQGSGRTDAGVHAAGQVAHLDTQARVVPGEFERRVNESLPADINFLRAERAAPRFHARHDAVARRYTYHIARRRTAFGKPFVWWVKDDLNLAHMAQAAGSFVGFHDFVNFVDVSGPDQSTRVKLEDIALIESGDTVIVRVEGSHFLWKMVRRLVGVLVEVGRDALSPAEASDLLDTPSDLPARLTAPASGLVLDRVFYRGDARTAPLRSPVGLHPAVDDGQSRTQQRRGHPRGRRAAPRAGS